jgi:hypothetical protein
MEFFNNKSNDTLKFKLNMEGININDIETRLIFENNNNINYMIKGVIEGENCFFDIPQLEIYDKDTRGKIKFEIISEDVYFNVWEETYNIKSKPTIKLEQVVENVKTTDKHLISSDPVIIKNRRNVLNETVEETNDDKLKTTTDDKEHLLTRLNKKEEETVKKDKQKETKSDDTVNENENNFQNFDMEKIRNIEKKILKFKNFI